MSQGYVTFMGVPHKSTHFRSYYVLFYCQVTLYRQYLKLLMTQFDFSLQITIQYIGCKYSRAVYLLDRKVQGSRSDWTLPIILNRKSELTLGKSQPEMNRQSYYLLHKVYDSVADDVSSQLMTECFSSHQHSRCKLSELHATDDNRTQSHHPAVPWPFLGTTSLDCN